MPLCSGGGGSRAASRALFAGVPAGAWRSRALALLVVTAGAVFMLEAGVAAQGAGSSSGTGAPPAGEARRASAPGSTGEAGAAIAPASPSTATIVTARGQVAWRRAGTEVWQKAEPGLALGSGDEILTWDGAHAVLQTAEGHRVELGPRTQIRVAELRAPAGSGQKGGSTRLRLWLGQIWSTVGELLGTESRYQVETDSAVAAVRGTEFYVESGTDGSTWVIVEEGEVEVEAAGQTVTVPAGYGVQVFAGQPPGQVQPMPYPTPPSEQPPVEPGQAEAPAPPPPPSPPPGAPGGLPASIETLTLEDVSVVSLGLNPELHLGSVGVSLDLRIYYTDNGDRMGFFLNRDTGEIIDIDKLRLGHVLQLIRWIEYDTPTFGARWGRLDPFTAGEGILVSGYRMGEGTGARIRADVGFGGGVVLVPTNPTTHLYAGRVFSRPMRSSPLQVGFQVAVERYANLEGKGEGLFRRTPAGPVRGYGIDVVSPLGSVTAYGQAAALTASDEPGEGIRWGASAGLSGSLGILGWRAEYRFGQGFAFGYFDGLYETWAGPGGDASRLALPGRQDAVNGYRLQADLAIPLIPGFEVGAFYEAYRGQSGRLGLHALVRVPDSLEATVSYLQSPVEYDRGLRLDAETALLTAEVRYPVRPGLYLILKRIQPFGTEGRRSFAVTTEFEL